MKADKAVFKVLLVILMCGCVATKTTKKGKNSKQNSEEKISRKIASSTAPGSTITCPATSGESEYCQVFTQEEGGGSRPIDILWVIDDSGSMNDDQHRLAQNFETFINQFAGQNQSTDFKMAITSAVPGDRKDYLAGKILDHSFLKSDHSGFINAFKSGIKVPGAAGTEHGLNANLQYLKNFSSFFRSDAYLIAIYVSDEDDQSVILPGAASGSDDDVADAYFQAISGLKPSPQLFKAFAIVTTNTGTNNDGHRYIKVTELTGGNAYDIINDSFAMILQDFGREVAKIASQFQLKYPAQLGTVEVYIDGSLAPQGDWNYLEGTNAIRFREGLFANKKGKSSIKVTYRTK